MKIDKAIEILEFEVHPWVGVAEHDKILAMRLGIEALKLVKELRRIGIEPPMLDLPGETE